MTPEQQTAYNTALERIEECRKLGKEGRRLALSGLGLSALPPEIGQLTALRTLDLSDNQLSALPPEIGQLTALMGLYLSHNQLSALPPEIGQLTGLTQLDLSDHQLSALPPEIGQLTALVGLYLNRNQLNALPPEIGQLTALRSINFDHNPLPEELLKLATGIGGVGRLTEYFRGITDGLKQGEAEQLRRFDEAKILFVGQGDVGKSWLLMALQGEEPMVVGSTKGIEIARKPLSVPHPVDAQRELRLNCWDFGGQDHFQITHQIFFSAKAIYLLIWKPRTGLDPELISKLERIQLSAGRTAKVLIVSSHADAGVPAVIGKDALKERFGDLIWGFYETDSEAGSKGTGISELRAEIAKAAAQLEGMELQFLKTWHAARKAVLGMGKQVMEFSEFSNKCESCGMQRDQAADLATIMEVQGHAVYFAEAEADSMTGLSGENLVVLHPEWLAKAVGHVIEDEPTIKSGGILDHQRLKTIWRKNNRRKCAGYDKKLHGYLLWLMWKFDIAYMRDASSSLIPQHIIRDRPDDLYWTPAALTPADERQVEIICRMPIDPPEGLIPALTAAVHPLRRTRDMGCTDELDRNWRNGFFLDSARRGAAYVELLDRDLRIMVRHGYPLSLLTMVEKTLEELRKKRWPRLEIDERVPCNGRKCKGSFRKSRMEEQLGKTMYCEDCGTERDVDSLLSGYNKQEEKLMEMLNDTRQNNQELLAMAHAIFKSLTPENHERERGPCMFTILSDKAKGAKKATHDAVRVTCWCEHPDGPHPATVIGSGTAPDYLLEVPKEWLVKASPYISWAAVLMKAFLPVGGSAIGMLNETGASEAVTLMKDAAKALPSGKLDMEERHKLEGMHRERPEIVALRHIHDTLLSMLKPAERWGDLRPVLTKSGEILWLCGQHTAVQQPPVTDISY